MDPVLNRGLFKVVIDDPSIQCVNEHIKNRYDRYLQKKREIERQEGSLSNFALSYKTYGIHRTATGIIYRE